MVSKPCIRCMESSDDIQRLVRCKDVRRESVWNTRMVVYRIRDGNQMDKSGEIEENRKRFYRICPSLPGPLCLKKSPEATKASTQMCTLYLNTEYALESLNNLHLGGPSC